MNGLIWSVGSALVLRDGSTVHNVVDIAKAGRKDSGGSGSAQSCRNRVSTQGTDQPDTPRNPIALTTL